MSQIHQSSQLRKLPPVFKMPRVPSQSQRLNPALPWPMKHAPRASAGLAIHKMKVAEVSKWLSNVYDEYHRKRVLVLKGPAGCGKTATLEVVASEGGWEIVEWANPTGGAGGIGGSGLNGEGWKAGGGETFASAFEDWLFRGGTWGCLDLVSAPAATNLSQTPAYTSCSESKRRKLLLLEDLPNLSHAGTLLSFRAAIRSYLALPAPPTNSGAPPIPPLVIIVSETSEGAGSSTSMGMSVHKIFGPKILSHPLLSEITFRKVAKTLLVKCLEEILKSEGYTGVFGKEVLEALAEGGDLRGAIGGLEMLVLGRGKSGGSGGGADGKGLARGKRKKSGVVGKEVLAILNPRFSTLGLFHAVGKIVYNKRYGDDTSDPYFPPPPKPPPSLLHRYHSRAMKLDPNMILDESGVDAEMFIYGVQENYVGSLTMSGGNKGRTIEEVSEDAWFCAEGLSLGDLLLGGCGRYGRGLGGDLGGGVARIGNWGNGNTAGVGGGDGVLRQEEIAAQVVVRTMALGLPSPVKRESVPSSSMSGSGRGRFGGGDRGGNQMYYPMGLRLWRSKEEIEGLVEMWEGKMREGGVDPGQMAMAGLTRQEIVLERLPFLARIAGGRGVGENVRIRVGQIGKRFMGATGSQYMAKGTQAVSTIGTSSHLRPTLSPALLKSLEQVTVFNGIGGPVQNEDFVMEDELVSDNDASPSMQSRLGEEKDESEDRKLMSPPPKLFGRSGIGRGGDGGDAGGDVALGIGMGVEGMVLEDDDIEDPDGEW
ncbi:Rad17 cell cycle checkpoint protein-domain-containing protein [Kalaharituber pfeilii]|nr:Rad17 cell cycle checkpoint protein-domain-containing protein [Kalaharituber pfeilii]